MPLKVYRDFVNGTAQPTRNTWVSTRYWYHMSLAKGRKWMQEYTDSIKYKTSIFLNQSRSMAQNDSLKDYRKEKLTDMEIKYNKIYPAFGKPAEKELDEWKKGHKKERWIPIPFFLI